MLGWEIEELVGNSLHALVHPMQPDGTPYSESACPICTAVGEGSALYGVEDVFRRKDGTELPVEYTSAPLREEGQLLGAVMTFQDITARRKAREKVRRQFEWLTALRAIDSAILTSLDLRFTLSVVIDQVLILLGGDAASIFLFDPTRQALDLVTGRGFVSRGALPTQVRLGEGYAGQVALEGRTIIHLDLPDQKEAFFPTGWIAREGFQEYYGIPLIARGQVKGVLEVYLRASPHLEEEWISFLETLAGQAAIAMDNVLLVDDLRTANRELTNSYDATVEGWSRTLELRDWETKGHSTRVTEMTLLLAQKMGISPEEQVHIRRGALLHDIGKMGVPDSILLKPGPLTAEEWAVMQKHPEYAYELLHPILFLRPALDIPLCHHEKWDGSGYPHGLRGEQIPLAARLFAVVDVWDALRYDRPYRPGWSMNEIRDHISGLSGSHFDPAVVEVFLSLID
jgi:PAS domain S-box-containing protein